jgi:hypothetical protein
MKGAFTPVAAANSFNASKYVRVPIRKKNTESLNQEGGFGQICSDFDRESSARGPINEGETVN